MLVPVEGVLREIHRVNAAIAEAKERARLAAEEANRELERAARERERRRAAEVAAAKRAASEAAAKAEEAARLARERTRLLRVAAERRVDEDARARRRRAAICARARNCTRVCLRQASSMLAFAPFVLLAAAVAALLIAVAYKVGHSRDAADSAAVLHPLGPLHPHALDADAAAAPTRSPWPVSDVARQARVRVRDIAIGGPDAVFAAVAANGGDALLAAAACDIFSAAAKAPSLPLLSQFRGDAVSLRGVRHAVDTIAAHASDSHAVSECASALIVLIESSPMVAQAAAASRAAAALVAALSIHAPAPASSLIVPAYGGGAAEIAVLALSTLARSCDAGRVACAAADAPRAIVGALRGRPSDVNLAYAGVAALANELVGADEAAAAAVVGSGALGVITASLKRHASTSVMLAYVGLGALANAAGTLDAARTAIAMAQGVPLVTHLMEVHSESIDVQRQGVRFAMSMSAGTAHQRDELMIGRAVRTAIRTLKRHTDDVDIATATTQLLKNLAHGTREQRIAALPGAKYLVRALKLHASSPSVSASACDALLDLLPPPSGTGSDYGGGTGSGAGEENDASFFGASASYPSVHATLQAVVAAVAAAQGDVIIGTLCLEALTRLTRSPMGESGTEAATAAAAAYRALGNDAARAVVVAMDLMGGANAIARAGAMALSALAGVNERLPSSIIEANGLVALSLALSDHGSDSAATAVEACRALHAIISRSSVPPGDWNVVAAKSVTRAVLAHSTDVPDVETECLELAADLSFVVTSASALLPLHPVIMRLLHGVDHATQAPLAATSDLLFGLLRNTMLTDELVMSASDAAEVSFAKRRPSPAWDMGQWEAVLRGLVRSLSMVLTPTDREGATSVDELLTLRSGCHAVLAMSTHTAQQLDIVTTATAVQLLEAGSAAHTASAGGSHLGNSIRGCALAVIRLQLHVCDPRALLHSTLLAHSGCTGPESAVSQLLNLLESPKTTTAIGAAYTVDVDEAEGPLQSAGTHNDRVSALRSADYSVRMQSDSTACDILSVMAAMGRVPTTTVPMGHVNETSSELTAALSPVDEGVRDFIDNCLAGDKSRAESHA